MQNSIKTRGNLCTELGSPVLVDVLYRCLEVFLLSRTQDRNDRSNGGWWAINIEMHYENDTQLPWGCLQDAAIIRKEIYTVIIINSEDSVNKSVRNATYSELQKFLRNYELVSPVFDLSQCLNGRSLSLGAKKIYILLAFILNRFLLAADGFFVRFRLKTFLWLLQIVTYHIFNCFG